MAPTTREDPALTDQPENTRRPQPEGVEQKSFLHDVVLPSAQPILGGGAAAYVGNKLSQPKEQPPKDE
jgi:hypothetical protein